MISVEVSTPNSVSVDDVVNRVEVDITTTGTTGSGGGGGGGDHGGLTGLLDDDHPQYQRADSVSTATSPYTITDESLVLSAGTQVVLPDAATNTGRQIIVGSTVGNVTVSPSGSDTIHGYGTSFTVLNQTGKAFIAVNISSTWGWIAFGESHSALAGLTNDDHPQYQRADEVFTSTDPYIVPNGVSFVASTGASVELPDAQTNAGRDVSVAAAAVTTTVSVAGTDTIFGLGSTVDIGLGNNLTFMAIEIGGSWGWITRTNRGPNFDLPAWFGTGLADGNAITIQSGEPAWTTGTRTAYEFLSGTGWTSDIPLYIPVKNTSGVTIAKGAPVYATGSVGASGAVEIAAADADDPAKMPAIGLLDSTLIPNAQGQCTVMGVIRGLDTGSYAINQPLYVSTTAGQLTGTKPTGTSELIQNICRVIRVNGSSGEVLVGGALRTNDVPNAIDAGKLTSGTVATARLGSGTASASTFLRGDQTYARPVVSAYYVTGRYYYPPNVVGGGSRALGSGAASATPYPIYQAVSVDGLQIDLSAATGSGQTIDLHVMTADANGDPDASVFTVTVTTTGTGSQALSDTTTAVALTPGLYYVVAHNTSASSLTSRGVASTCHIPPIPAAIVSTANQYSGWLKTPGTGAITSYPAVTAVTDNVNQAPLVAMRFT